MADGVTRDAVKNFVLSDCTSLELAFLIDEALHGATLLVPSTAATEHGICAELIDRLLTTLEDHVRNQLGEGWEINRTRLGPDFLSKETEFWIRKPNWPNTQGDSPTGVYLQAARGLWRDLVIGFIAHRDDFPPSARNRIQASLGPLMPNRWEEDWWPVKGWNAADPLPSNFWDSAFLVRVCRESSDESSRLRQEIQQLGNRLVGLARAVPDSWWV